MKPLIGKTALVTGSSRSLGKEIAIKLAENGANLLICYRQQKAEADNVVKKIKELGQNAIALQADLNGTHDLTRFCENIHKALVKLTGEAKLDILINNAGMERSSVFGNVSEKDFDEMFDTNVKSPFFLTQSLLPILQKDGRIIMIGSGLSRFSLPPFITYAATKAALTNLSQYMAKSLGEKGITVNTVAPGALDTDFNRANFEKNPQVVEIIKNNTALGRVGTPQDVGSVVAFLCSSEARWITGQRIEVSGGMYL